MRLPRSVPGRLVAVAALVVAGLSGCGPSTLVNPGTANCYQSLPLAVSALHASLRTYHFVGIRRVPGRVILKKFPDAPVRDQETVCAFAFTGTFAAGQVQGAEADQTGRAALVITTTNRHLIGSVVLAKLPERFSHLAHP